MNVLTDEDKVYTAEAELSDAEEHISDDPGNKLSINPKYVVALLSAPRILCFTSATIKSNSKLRLPKVRVKLDLP